MKSPAEPTTDQSAAARLTAWALDEIPASGQPDMQADLTRDPALLSEAEATRAFCQMLGSRLRNPENPPLQLSPEARRTLEATAAKPAPRRLSLWMPALAAAAGLAVMIGVLAQNRRQVTMARNPAGSESESAKTRHEETTRLFRIGLGYFDLGEFKQAQAYFKQVLALEPGNTAAQRELERSRLDSTDTAPEVAEIPSEPGARTSKKNAEVTRLFRTGLGYYDLGQFSKAEEQFNELLALDPTNTAARRQLERTQRDVNSYVRTARDHTRLKMLNDIDRLWETAVPGTARVPAADKNSAETVQDWPERPDDFTDLNRPVYSSADPALTAAADAYYHESGKAGEKTTAESYRGLPENKFLSPAVQPLSTFSIDVDTASYAIVRRHLNEGQRPPAAVRLEELINYFPMDDAPPADGKPFAVHVETASAPWAADHRLVRVALKGKTMAAAERPAANLVFLVDTSGSMAQPNKLPLVQQSLQLLLSQLEPRDRVALVTYAGESRVVLPSTPVSERAAISAAIDALASSGGTNGAGGITAAYEVARGGFLKGGVNRVILATDGDFNIGVTSEEGLEALITKEAKSGVYLSVLAYGSDNLKDTTAELLADKGNGNYAYIDSLSEARRALVGQLSGTLVTIAKDVKIQVEFNPARVSAYRLLGYENRALADRDFNDDTKDAGEIGAGHSVTALYEIIPAGTGAPVSRPGTDPLKYQTPAVAPGPDPRSLTPEAANGEMLTVKLRWQQPEGAAPSELMEIPVKDSGTAWAQAGENFRWTAAAAGYGLLLRGSAHAGSLTWETVRGLAAGAKGADPDGFRGEFLQLIDKAAGLAPRPEPRTPLPVSKEKP
ncbi:MAG: von Willebrand factor type A domain-containing protein [Verrucomicrobiota bacterium]